MCLNARKVPFDVNDSVAPIGLTWLILDEIGAQIHGQPSLRVQTHDGARNFTNTVVLNHDHLCEDG